MSAARARSTRIIVRSRSSRSASAPACSAKSSHGSRAARATPATAPGERVMPQREQGERDLEDAVGEVRQRRRGEQLPVGRSEGARRHRPQDGHSDWEKSITRLTALGCRSWPVPSTSTGRRRWPSTRRSGTRCACASCGSASTRPARTASSPTASRPTRRRVLHHVRTLVEHGFLEEQPARVGKRGAREKPYRATGLSWYLTDDEVPADERHGVGRRHDRRAADRGARRRPRQRAQREPARAGAGRGEREGAAGPPVGSWPRSSRSAAPNPAASGSASSSRCTNASDPGGLAPYAFSHARR